MRIHRWFLTSSIATLVCLVFLPSSLAQEKLPAIVKRIEPSTIVILTYDKQGEVLGQGSGFFISQNGDIITNRHVLHGASRAEIKTAEGEIYSITQIVAEDVEGDIIRGSVNIPVEAVHTLSVGASVPEVGERVIVIGSPLGLERTVADGIVSAVREIPAFGKIIQITASISPGSSGSPVVNMKGEVIGVATFQIVEGQNLNFAIPGERIAKLTLGKGKTLAEWQMGRAEEWHASAEALCDTGFAVLWTGNYEKALPYFEKVAEKDPQDAIAYFVIGYCNDQLGRYTEAIFAYKRGISIKPDYAEAHFGLGSAYWLLGRRTEAIGAFKQAIRIKPDYAKAHCGLGITYNELGRYTEAIEALKQAIHINPDLALAHRALGLAYGNLGGYSEAIGAFKQAIRIKPDYAEAHFSLGWVYDQLARYTGAIEAYKQAIRINPGYFKAHFGLGSAYSQLGRYNEAVEALKQAIRINPDCAEVHCALGLVYSQLGRYTESIEAYKQAIHIKPDFAGGHYGLGLNYLILGDRGSALDEYKILKDLDKDLANTLFNLIYE